MACKRPSSARTSASSGSSRTAVSKSSTASMGPSTPPSLRSFATEWKNAFRKAALRGRAINTCSTKDAASRSSCLFVMSAATRSAISAAGVDRGSTRSASVNWDTASESWPSSINRLAKFTRARTSRGWAFVISRYKDAASLRFPPLCRRRARSNMAGPLGSSSSAVRSASSASAGAWPLVAMSVPRKWCKVALFGSSSMALRRASSPASVSPCTSASAAYA
mmetsp:Transcript_253/g.832  ORF Transcript_253/g.832 Transcript_253/m.832 type:complete len:222 (+) Transcript_253:345-1010(+)